MALTVKAFSNLFPCSHMDHRVASSSVILLLTYMSGPGFTALLICFLAFGCGMWDYIKRWPIFLSLHLSSCRAIQSTKLRGRWNNPWAMKPPGHFFSKTHHKGWRVPAKQRQMIISLGLVFIYDDTRKAVLIHYVCGPLEIYDNVFYEHLVWGCGHIIALEIRASVSSWIWEG